MPSSALGIIEVRSLASAIDALNTAINAAPVEVAGTSYALPGVVLIALRGSVDAVSESVNAVRDRFEPAGKVHGYSILARPDDAIDALLAQRFVPIGARAGAPALPGRGPMHGSDPDTKPAVPVETTMSDGGEPPPPREKSTRTRNPPAEPQA